MLEYIRSNAQSLGVKLAFGVIILVFVFWGVGSMSDQNASNVVGMVNGKALTAIAFEKTYRQAEENLRRTNPGITSDQFKQFQLPRQVLQQMVVESVLQQEAERQNIVVSPLELRLAVEQMPVFQNAEGKFDPEAYKRIMAAQRQSMGAFEDGLRRQLLEEKLRRDVTAGGVVTAQEARTYFNFLQEQRDVNYVFFAASDYPQPEPAEDEIKAYYESQRTAFAIPAKADVEYILLRPADLVKASAVNAAEVQAYYDKNVDKFTVPARAKVRHILLRLAPDASQDEVQKATTNVQEIAAKLAKGADFAALATKHSQDEGTAGVGGSLDWIGQGETVPPFNDAVFAMKAGEISPPVRTDFGLHLIKVEAQEKDKVKALGEVEKDIRDTLAQMQGTDKIREVLDSLIEANILGKPLAEAAAAHGLSAKRTGAKSVAELQTLLEMQPKEAQMLLDTPAGSPVDTALEAKDDGYIVAKVVEKVAASTLSLAEVRADIVKTLGLRLALEAATKAATEARKDMDKDVPAALKGRIKAIKGVLRGDALGDLGEQTALSAALFAAPEGQWLSDAYAVNLAGQPGAVLVRTSAIKAPDDQAWEPLAPLVINSLETQRKNQMFQAFVSVLLSKAKVEITNTAFLQRLEDM